MDDKVYKNCFKIPSRILFDLQLFNLHCTISQSEILNYFNGKLYKNLIKSSKNYIFSLNSLQFSPSKFLISIHKIPLALQCQQTLKDNQVHSTHNTQIIRRTKTTSDDNLFYSHFSASILCVFNLMFNVIARGEATKYKNNI